MRSKSRFATTLPVGHFEDMDVHHMLDFEFGPDGLAKLKHLIEEGVDPNLRAGSYDETLLHVATRRYRIEAVKTLLANGADIDARTKGGKTAYAHAIRRGFKDLATILATGGANTTLSDPDLFAVAVVEGRLEEAGAMLAKNPTLARTGNPEEDRLFADVAGRNPKEPVELLIKANADLTATGLDTGTPLHQAAWFGQPVNAKLLVDAGAPLDVFDETHESSPLHWAVHGSRYSGGADERQPVYVELVRILLEAGSSLHYPNQPDSDAYKKRLLQDATPEVAAVIKTKI